MLSLGVVIAGVFIVCVISFVALAMSHARQYGLQDEVVEESTSREANLELFLEGILFELRIWIESGRRGNFETRKGLPGDFYISDVEEAIRRRVSSLGFEVERVDRLKEDIYTIVLKPKA